MTPYEILGHAAVWIHGVLGAASLSDSGAPTPCPGWSVADVVDHVVDGNLAAAASIRQSAVPVVGPHAADGLKGDLQERHRASVAEAMTAFQECTALNQPVTLDDQVVDGETLLLVRAAETLVHGWDLAVALGFPDPPPAALVAAALEPVCSVAELRRHTGLLSPPVAVAADSPTLAHIVAAFGRDPSWADRQPLG